jgi:imidazole glycerol phosphate synthase glutamine amidotransferase subunit
MTLTIGLLSYGESANTYSVKKALEKVGSHVIPVESTHDLSSAEMLVLPGVGGFKDAMEHLEEIAGDLVDAMHEKPTLGICLGMQILAKIGYEYGEKAGLGIVDAQVERIEVSCKVPHLGWGSLKIERPSPIFEGIGPSDHFYFMHSYEMTNCPEVVARSRYCDHDFVSAVQKNSIFGVQFHPEKSRDAGLTILKNFIQL